MFYYFRYLFIFGLVLPGLANAGQVLSLLEAEQLALTEDPGIKRFGSLAQAMEENSVAVGQLPDPKLKLGFMNFPTNTFARDQEPMTQIQVGVQQMFPRGKSLDIKSQQSLSGARVQEQRGANRERMIRKTVRLKWLEFFYWLKAENIVFKNRKLFEQLVEVAQYHYGAGRRNQQDVIRAQLELSRLDDRILDIKTRQEKIRAELGVLINRPSIDIVLPEKLPILYQDIDLDQLVKTLDRHPKILAAQAMVKRGQQGVSLAREAYKPAWGLGVTYGFRDGQNGVGVDRPDFLSLGISLDIPLFQEKRQDRKLKASQFNLGANRQMLDQQYLDLKQALERDHADWLRLTERVSFYHKTLVPQAKQNTEAAFFAYQNDRADFPTVMKARITELNTELKSIRMHVNRAKSEARLRYISGEEK
ncbi:MAG: TolC family protein [Gammaproteobacteria bacterium]|nr:TolC family protein [Gammaproteobacteria bacterium]